MAELALSAKEAAEALGVDIQSIYLMVYRKEIPHRRVVGRGKKGQGKILIPRTALIKWLEGGEEPLPMPPNPNKHPSRKVVNK